MSTFLNIVEDILTGNWGDAWSQVLGIFTPILNMLDEDETKIILDATTQYQADRKAGKSFGEASADALSVFFNEEKGEFSKLAQAVFQVFLQNEAKTNS